MRPVTLEWAGKSAALAPLTRPLVALEPVERAGRGDEPRGRLVQGDAVDVARALVAEGLGAKVDLVYLDPPFGSGVDYAHEERLDGAADGRVARARAYVDTWGGGPADYLDMLYPRLAAVAPLLAPTGSVWVHLDWRASYLVRALCDEIFGRERFLNEIVWRRAPNLGRQARSGQFGRTLDTLLVYGGPNARLVPPTRRTEVPASGARVDAEGRSFTLAPRGDYTDASVARLDAEGRIHRTASGRVYVKYWVDRDADGRLWKAQPVDTLWTDVPPLRHASPEERTGYPTQKPRALLERIVAAASPPGGLVVDLFAGSGTTGAAAWALGRRFVLADVGDVAIAAARARLLRDGVDDLSIERCGRSPASCPGVSATARREHDGSVEVIVHASADHEPIAWSVGLRRGPGGCVEVLAHHERGTGRSPAPLALRSVVAAGAERTLALRVLHVDGTVAELDVSVRAATTARSAARAGAA